MIYVLLYLIIGIMVAVVFRTKGDVDGVLFLFTSLLWPIFLTGLFVDFLKDMLK